MSYGIIKSTFNLLKNKNDDKSCIKSGSKGDVNLGTKKKHFYNRKVPNSLPLDRGTQIGAYSYSGADEWCEKQALCRDLTGIRRIIFQEVSNAGLQRRIKATIQQDIILGDSINFLIPKTRNISLEAALGIVNSKVVNFYFKFYSQTNHVPIGDFKEIPFPEISIKTQNTIAEIVIKILELKAKDKESDISQLEGKIDEIVYRLYGLTYDEVLIVDPETTITREEYDNCG